jgi:hypothetical protein
MVIKKRYRKFLKLFVGKLIIVKDDPWEKNGGLIYFSIKKPDNKLVLVASYDPNELCVTEKYFYDTKWAYNRSMIGITNCLKILCNYGLKERIESYEG